MHFLNSAFYSIVYEVKQAYLSLKQKPLFIFSVVSTMGITLGALLCVLTLAYVMLIKPLPYPEQDKLYQINRSVDNSNIQHNYPSLIKLYNQQKAMSATSLFTFSFEVITSSTLQPRVLSSFVTSEWFSLLGASFILGRGFEQTEAINKHNPVIILSYKIWAEYFNKKTDILNEKISLMGKSFRVIGVLDKSFVEPELYFKGLKTAIWLPWDFNPNSWMKEQWTTTADNLLMIGKLGEETKSQSEQLLSLLLTDIQHKNTNKNNSIINIQLRSLKEVIIGYNHKNFWLLFAAILALTFIAIGNILNLFISKIAESQPKLAIHASLGAKKTHLFRLLVIESALLMTIALIVALIISHIGFTILQQNFSLIYSRLDELTVSFFTLISALILLILLCFFFAFISMHILNYRLLNNTLKNSSKGSNTQISNKFRKTLIISQIAITMTLVFANISIFKKNTDIIFEVLGFETENIFSLQMSNNSLLTSSPEETELFTAQIKNALLQLPQVIDLAQAPTFLTGFSSTNLFPNLKNDFESIPSVHFLNVDDRYFNIMNQKFIIGRNFTQIEVKNGQPIAIINNILANKISTYNTSIGKKIRISDNSQLYTIIGVVNSVKSPANNLIPPRIYLPTKQTNLNFIIKLQANQQLSSGEIKRMVQKTNNGYLVTIFTDMNTLKNNYLIKQKIAAYSSIVLSFFTLFIAAIGLYGILSYSTQMRRFEIGTRMAIGAKRGDLIRLIIKDNAKAILLGIGISVLLLTGFALGFNKQLEPYLTWQLIPLFLVTLGLVSLISFAACYLPLRQYINKPAVYSLRGSE